jgi:hypothetical protein
MEAYMVPHITIEYVIMLPLLILQIILFPLVASLLMNVWVDSRRTLALQEAASSLGSSMQQIYFTLNHDTIPVGTSVTQKSNVPAFIEDYAYTGNATLQTVSTSLNSSKVLKITLKLKTVGTRVTTSAILGQNVQWSPLSTFISNSTIAGILARKVANGANVTILLSFTG